MKNSKIVMSTLVTVMLLSGCGATSSALYPAGEQQVVKIEKVKEFDLLTPAKTEKAHFHILYKAKHTKPSPDDYVNARGSTIDLSKLPTVVIALPVETKRERSGANELDKTGEFKTEGYISKSEETVEKELIRAGYNVIDRSKFEAKLRTTREAKLEKMQTKGDNLYDAQIDGLKSQLRAGKITNKEYIDKISKLNDATSSRKQGDKELIDMSELIRAAQSNGVQADYILQLNKIEEYNGYLTSLPLRGQKDIEDYLAKNPDISYGEGKNKIPESFNTKVFRVVFSAKLFNVKSGKVVWSGSHELNSQDIEDITVDFDILKKDTSSKNINNNRIALNNKVKALYEETKNAEAELKKLYEIASKERTYKDEASQKYHESKLKNNINKYEQIIAQNNENIKSFNVMVKSSQNESIKFEYIVSDLYIKPNLNASDKSMDPREKKVIQKHRSKLLSETIRSLFNTIKVKNG